MKFPSFQNIIGHAIEVASEHCDLKLAAYLLDDNAPFNPAPPIDDSNVAPICIFIYQYAVASWLRELGVPLDAVLGHSIGEIAAAGAHETHHDLPLDDSLHICSLE